MVTGENPILYFNKNGTAYDFHAKRLSTDREEKGKAILGAMDADERERNVLMIFQIPLKVARDARSASSSWGMDGAEGMCYPASASCSPVYYDCCNESKQKSRKTKGIEDSVLSLGNSQGPYVGTKGSQGQDLKLERDTDYPIRCTLQMYQVTDSPNIPEAVFKTMSDKIASIYKNAEASGSLVFSDTSVAGLTRLTEPVLNTDKAKEQTQQAFLASLSKISPMFNF